MLKNIITFLITLLLILKIPLLPVSAGVYEKKPCTIKQYTNFNIGVFFSYTYCGYTEEEPFVLEYNGLISIYSPSVPEHIPHIQNLFKLYSLQKIETPTEGIERVALKNLSEEERKKHKICYGYTYSTDVEIYSIYETNVPCTINTWYRDEGFYFQPNKKLFYELRLEDVISNHGVSINSIILLR